MKVDVHSHFYPSDYVNAVRKFDAAKGSQVTGLDFPLWTSSEERIKVMDDFGVDTEILSLSAPNVYFEDDALSLELAQMTNEFLSQLSRECPGRFVGMASIPMSNVDHAIEELHRAVERLGLTGVVIGSHINGKRPDSPEFEPVLAEIERLGQPVFLHPMPLDEGPQSQEYKLSALLSMPFETTICVTRLIFAGVFERHPKLALILAHQGGTLPFLFNRIDLGFKSYRECRQKAARLPSDYLKGFYYETALSFARSTLLCTADLVGMERIMYGTDYPFASGLVGKTAAAVEELGVEPEVKTRIFAGNARSLFRL